MKDKLIWRAVHLPNCVVIQADSMGVSINRIDGKGGMFIGAKAFVTGESLDMIEGFFGEDKSNDKEVFTIEADTFLFQWSVGEPLPIDYLLGWLLQDDIGDYNNDEEYSGYLTSVWYQNVGAPEWANYVILTPSYGGHPPHAEFFRDKPDPDSQRFPHDFWGWDHLRNARRIMR